MKQNVRIRIVAMLLLLAVMTSCEAIAGIFKAGMGVGIFIVVAIIAVVGYFVYKATRNNT